MSASNSSSGSAQLGIDEVWQVFASIEQAEKLPAWRIGGVYLWPLLRDRLMREVAEQLGIYERRPEQTKVTDAPPAQFQITPSEYAVIPFLRRNPQGIDPFSAPVVEALEADGISPLIFGMGVEDLDSGRPQVEHLEREFVHRYRNIAKFMVAPWVMPALGGKAHIAKYARVIRHIETSLPSPVQPSDAGTNQPGSQSVAGRYRKFPRWLLVEFTAQKIGWKQLFSKAGVRKLFVVNAWKRALIAGAQEAGVWVVELQHGATSSIHPLLSWPGQEHVAYLPNEFYQWGQYWSDCAQLPSDVVRTTIGAPNAITNMRSRQLAKIANSVLVTSQAHATSSIVAFVKAAAQAHPTAVFTIKPHPQEDVQQIHRLLTADQPSGLMPSNVRVAEVGANTLELMARSQFVLGVYSTALFEATALGAKVGVLKFAGWGHIRALVERGDATLIESAAQFADFLTGGQQAGPADYYFDQPLSTAQLLKQVKL